MNRQIYYNDIDEKLTHLATRIKKRGVLNLLDLNLHSENFYQHFFNLLFGWQLININEVQQNSPAIDLIDRTNKIIISVSSTASRRKIESTLFKDLSDYDGYFFKFILISNDADTLKRNSYINNGNINFNPSTDIYDIDSILRKIYNFDIDKMKAVYSFLRNELHNEPDPEKMESNLATIITILSKENWDQDTLSYEIVPYDIAEKISYNQLDNVVALINEFKIHYHRIDKIYSEFNKQGVNKSTSILNGIRTEYLNINSEISPDQRFLSVIDKVVEKIRISANYIPIPEEELSQCVQILVVDAFIRCKIFNSPLGDTDACS